MKHERRTRVEGTVGADVEVKIQTADSRYIIETTKTPPKQRVFKRV